MNRLRDVNIAEMFSDRLVYDQEENGEKKFLEIIRNYGSIEKFIRHYNNRRLTIEEDAKLMPITTEEKREELFLICRGFYKQILKYAIQRSLG